mgnify:CR=1 FL=1
MSGRRPLFLVSVLAFGYAFLYLPILFLVVYSFNASRLVTVWGGFSTKWYGELLANERMLEAAWLSLRIAAVNHGYRDFGDLTGAAVKQGDCNNDVICPEGDAWPFAARWWLVLPWLCGAAGAVFWKISFLHLQMLLKP